ncbi:MAG: diguanylate cyclase [Spirochaetales bacterium]
MAFRSGKTGQLSDMPSRINKSGRWPSTFIVVGIMLAIALAWVGMMIAGEYRNSIATTRGILEESINQRVEFIQSRIKNIDLILQHYVKSDGAIFKEPQTAIKAQFGESIEQVPEILGLISVDASGTVVGSWVDSGIGVIVADREYFQFHRDSPAYDTRLFISRPSVTRISGIYSITLTRALRGENGEFLGLILASLNPRYFSETLQHPEGSIIDKAFIINRAGDVIQTMPETPENFQGRIFLGASGLNAHIESGLERSFLFADAKSEGYRGLLVLQNVLSTDLIVGLSRDYDNFIRSFIQYLYPKLLFSAFLMLTTLVLAYLLNQRQRVLVASEKFNRSLIETANDIILGLDVHGVIRLVNRSAEQTLGYMAREMQGKTWWDLLSPGENREETKSDFMRIISEKADGQHHEITVLSKGGRRLQISWNYISMERNPRDISVIAFGRDITEKKLKDEELLRSNEEIKKLSAWRNLLLNSAGEGLFGVDQEHRCIFMNPAALMMLGFEEGEVIGQDVHTLFRAAFPDGTISPEDQSPIHRTGIDGVMRKKEGAFIRKNGTSFEVELTTTPIMEDGRQTGVEVVFTDITRRKEMELELMRLATTDPLTGLPNRRSFIQEVEVEMVHSRFSPKNPTAFLMIDLDHFKRVNDDFGHAAGDAVLKAFAAELQKILRKSDLLGRIGGEEFGVLLRFTDLPSAARLAEKLRARVSAMEVPFEGTMVRITVSIGITVQRPGDDSLDTLMSRADTAMYAAKNAGRDRVEIG